MTRSFFNFSRGEWIAAIFISIMLFSTLIVKNAYPKRQIPLPLSEDYFTKIEQFTKRQRTLADSTKQSRSHEKKQASYASRNYDRQQTHFVSGIIPDDSVKRKTKTPSYAIVKVDLNNCDTSDITVIPLFGAKRAAKIVEYREQLGGYHNLTQLHDIFIIQNITMEHIEKYFIIKPKNVKKIMVNQTEYAELAKHPYFDSYLAKTVLQYRKKNGAIRDLEHFREITHAYQELIDKLTPYLDFGEKEE